MAEGVPSVRNTRLDSKHGRMPHGYAPLLVALQTFIAYWRTFRVQRRPPVGHERRHWAAALGARGWPLQASPPAGFKFATVKLENRDGSWRPCPVMGTATPWPATPSPWQDTAMAEGGGKHIPSSVASQGCKSPIRLWADGGNVCDTQCKCACVCARANRCREGRRCRRRHSFPLSKAGGRRVDARRRRRRGPAAGP